MKRNAECSTPSEEDASKRFLRSDHEKNEVDQDIEDFLSECLGTMTMETEASTLNAEKLHLATEKPILATEQPSLTTKELLKEQDKSSPVS